MDHDRLWQTKLAARIHDPAEKALVLLRDPAGHEGGTSRALARLLGYGELGADTIDPDDVEALSTVLFKNGIPRAMYETVRRADWWAAAADRPQWPMQEVTLPSGRTLKVADWAQVRWTHSQNSVLIHPLTGEQFSLPGGLGETDIEDIKRRSLNHFARLRAAVERQGGGQDWKRILLTYWRFGPDLVEEEDFGKLGVLWRLLPADTRVPDHSIWDHLDLVSAFAGAFAADPQGEAALLALAIGPVQGFIAAARSTSDLWAGSHLLSRLAWEAMRPVAEALGPDAILFPRLRGVPQVDLWLRDAMGLPAELFAECEWARGATDSNPLFSAALPNRFVALVPVSQARALAEQARKCVRQWLQDIGRSTVDRLLEAAGLGDATEKHCHRQMRDQLAGFPEVHWAAVPFSLIRPRDAARQTDLDVSGLACAMAPFFGVEEEKPAGFLATPAWALLSKELDLADGVTFFSPNPGVLYPAVHDLAERVLAAAKGARTFDQVEQTGWRCSLTGETEWLTTDPDQLQTSYRKRDDTLWARVAEARPAWAKPGEHLGALPALKRLWPTLFAEEVREATGSEVQRFVVSTHTMALAHQLEQWVERGGLTASGFQEACTRLAPEAVALPRRLARLDADRQVIADARRMLGLLEAARDAGDEREYERARDLVCRTLASGREDGTRPRLENYYALLLMDGDRMGAWLSGGDDYAISYRDSFHPQVRRGFDQHADQHDAIRLYGKQARAISPGRHLAISGALNDFALTVVRHVVEEEYLGRVIYAGGDDVLAMLPVADLLPAMERLRQAYSGVGEAREVAGTRLALDRGFALMETRRGERRRLRLMRTMGARATASCGAVVAHHLVPLGAVLRELRQAETRAKSYSRPDGDGRWKDRDAFSLTVIKRSGGALQLAADWGEPVALLSDLRSFLADPGVSRRAVYHSLEWLADLPEPAGDGAMLQALLGYQLGRQAKEGARGHHDVPGLARRLATLALAQPRDRRKWLANFLTIAEFLARETRTGGET